jgi:hypothetical protein
VSRESPGIVGRIRQMHRAAVGSESVSPPSAEGGDDRLFEQVAELETRLAHLEELIQGLQDSVHRGSERQNKRISDIEQRLDPAVLAAALSKDARDRGL